MSRLAAICALASLGLAAAQQPDPQAMAWLHEPKRILEETRLGAHHERPRATALLSEGASAGAAKIIREISGVERKVADVMHGHPQELMQEEKLLHQASEMALRAGQMSGSRRAGHRHAALLQQHKASSHVSAKATVAAEARELSGIASQEAVLARADSKILKETAMVQAAAKSALSGKEAAEVSGLLSEIRADQHKVVASEKRSLKITKKELRGLRGSSMLQRTGGKAMASVAAEAISEERAYARKEMHLARDGRHIISELSTAKDAVESALGSRAGQVEALLEQAQAKQTEVVHNEVKGVNQSAKRIREIAAEARRQ